MVIVMEHRGRFKPPGAPGKREIQRPSRIQEAGGRVISVQEAGDRTPVFGFQCSEGEGRREITTSVNRKETQGRKSAMARRKFTTEAGEVNRGVV